MSDTPLLAEEQVVAELSQWGIGYLSRDVELPPFPLRAPDDLLAAIVRQPSSRVRVALIALLLARPEFANAVPAALRRLAPAHAQTLKFLYTAAVLLQQQFAAELQTRLGPRWSLLPDWFADDLRVAGDTPLARLQSLAGHHAQWSGEHLNWAGTYENAARLLLRRWEMEHAWSR